MTIAPAILLLVMTLAAGVAAGLLFLQRARRPWLVTAHLVLALGATAAVALLLATNPRGEGGPPGLVPLVMLTVSLAAGWSAGRIARRRRPGATLLLAGHAVLGVAGFLVFLAWARNL
ncbi:hypothetical protein [Falsiroseomonas sp.]|uniref:hypothetical protein n=1 Tax=Falsiroseomonas sp. TaxID=2870721 RepID=UPI00271A309E|nr:hypothetical protein [Falsiroseomonas sp.]MDO9500132.1 hypothetical protein [Falsiroseomonas sp.]